MRPKSTCQEYQQALDIRMLFHGEQRESVRPQGKVKRSPWTSVDVTVVAYWYKVQRSGAGRGTKWDKDGRGPAVSTEMYALYSYTYRSREARHRQKHPQGGRQGRGLHLPSRSPRRKRTYPSKRVSRRYRYEKTKGQIEEMTEALPWGRQRGPLPRENGRRGGDGDECKLYLLHGGRGHETCLVVRCVDGRR